jgi:DNA-binding TFAR19-related protein (PDSD5 family)
MIPPQEEPSDDIEVIKSRKMVERWRQAISHEKVKQRIKEQQQQQKEQQSTDRKVLLRYLYNRGDEVLALAESQFPNETRVIANRLVELIKNGNMNERISGGELLGLFRSLGMNIKVDTSIKIEDHGKLLSFSDKLKEDYGEI